MNYKQEAYALAKKIVQERLESLKETEQKLIACLESLEKQVHDKTMPHLSNRNIDRT